MNQISYLFIAALLRAILNVNPLHRAGIKRIQAHPWYIKDFTKERGTLFPASED
jgi:hypothetical protein